jgi:hypothetical protein
MIAEVKGARLLRGFRGRPAADLEALEDTLVRVSYLAMHLEGHLAELDINPLMVLPISRARSSMASTRSITLPTRSPASAVHLRPPHCGTLTWNWQTPGSTSFGRNSPRSQQN